MKFTDLEKQVFNAAVIACFDDYSADAEQISGDTGLELSTVKGVLGSLEKKGKLIFETVKREGIVYHDVFISDLGWDGSFGCDCFGFEEYKEKFLLA